METDPVITGTAAQFLFGGLLIIFMLGMLTFLVLIKRKEAALSTSQISEEHELQDLVCNSAS